MNKLADLFKGMLFAHGHFATVDGLRAAGLLPEEQVQTACEAAPDTRATRPANVFALKGLTVLKNPCTP